MYRATEPAGRSYVELAVLRVQQLLAMPQGEEIVTMEDLGFPRYRIGEDW